ncbi:helix-turn-helix domain-containing protein [Aeoliella sp. ICT_H6.2]|uniref:Helix-turn-helix domain-containing protein n=1 Tax=Aeoliella straminimaris TaxID=2954799 RepID=A0A9X2F6X1_9BACT|nr:helix-turn-helix domain-containing protein [Aeoliella straminimaris]MCO6043350.1 helix-turn-helix domain-containing protein [Aeoliella straminimaris]
MSSAPLIPSPTDRDANARQIVEKTYARWLGKTDDTTAAAILTQTEMQLQHSNPAGANIETTPGNGPLSVKQAADELGVSKETVYKLCSENALRHTRVGRRITITRQQLEDYRDRPKFRHVAA